MISEFVAAIQQLNFGPYDQGSNSPPKGQRRKSISRPRSQHLQIYSRIPTLLEGNFIIYHLNKTLLLQLVLNDETMGTILPQLMMEAEYFMIDPLIDQLRFRQERMNKRDVLLVWNEGGVIKYVQQLRIWSLKFKTLSSRDPFLHARSARPGVELWDINTS